MKYLIIVLIIIILVVIFLFYKLKLMNNRCLNALSQIDNQLKRRNDLIPNLVNITKGYARYETDTLEKLIKARSTNIKDKALNDEYIKNSIDKLLMLKESYPELKANELFLKLQVELVGTEDKIAFARQFYNDCVQQFNTYIEVFPNNILANILKYKNKEYFKVDDEEKEKVVVDLDDTK